MYADKYVHRPSDIPKESHFAIIKGSSHYTPGDERSRTNPGHGYPASTDYYVTYEAYLSREKWEAAILELENPKYGSKDSYVALEVKPATVGVSVKVDVK